jgi:diguanylate cyclase (GGDEF)-like protein
MKACEHAPLDSLGGFELRLRAQMIRAGVWLTYAACAMLAAWVAVTRDRPNRPAMTVILVVAVAVAGGVSRASAARIVRSRWREAFFLGWSVADILLISLLADADGGAASPATALFFLTVVFAALSYPLLSVLAVSVLNLFAFGVLGVFVSAEATPAGLRPADMWIFGACLALTSVMCVWQSRIQSRMRSELARASRTDPLTGSLNRRGLEEILDVEIDISRARAGRFGLVVLDLDHFKEVNDRFGHGAGDDLLRWTVLTMRYALGPCDAVGRLGGDEFAVLLRHADRADAALTTRRLRQALAERVGATTGVACFPADGATREELHRHADADLYSAKRARPVSPGRTAEIGGGPGAAAAVGDATAAERTRLRS